MERERERDREREGDSQYALVGGSSLYRAYVWSKTRDWERVLVMAPVGSAKVCGDADNFPPLFTSP